MTNSASIYLPREVLYIIKQLQDAGFEATIVGGAVRDLIKQSWQNLPQAPLPYQFDFDFTTNAKPEETLRVFPQAFYENRFGTVSITLEHLWQMMEVSDEYKSALQTILSRKATRRSQRIIDLANAKKVHTSLKESASAAAGHSAQTPAVPNFEITTYRSNELYQQGPRKPSSLNWGSSLEEDLNRRDFTINAMAINIDPRQLLKIYQQATATNAIQLSLAPNQYQLIDQHHSLRDLTANLIRTVGDPNVRFSEDALRMLRAIRFAVELNFQIEPATLIAVKQNKQFLPKISDERIRDEFLKMLISPQPKLALELLDNTGLLQFILPELLEAKNIEQGGHHLTDVWTHSLDALDNCPSPDPVVRLATLLHDISKPQTRGENNGEITFYNHEVIGARVAKRIATRLKLSSHDQQRVFILVRYHMFHYQPENSDASIRRFMRKVGLEHIDDILDLREADRLGSGARKSSWRLEEMKQRMIAQLNQPLDVTDLAIDGHDLMQELGIERGPKIGKLLQALFEKVLENPSLNERSTLLDLTKELLG